LRWSRPPKSRFFSLRFMRLSFSAKDYEGSGVFPYESKKQL